MSQQLPEAWFVKDARVNAAISWLLVAVFGTAHLSGVSDQLLARLESDSVER